MTIMYMTNIYDIIYAIIYDNYIHNYIYDIIHAIIYDNYIYIFLGVTFEINGIIVYQK